MEDWKAKTGSQPHILLLAQPRTGSYLFLKMLGLENQRGVHFNNNGSFYRDATLVINRLGLGNKDFEDWSEIEISEVMKNFKSCTDNLKRFIATAKTEDKTVFMKDHPQFMWNPNAKVLKNTGVLHAILPDQNPSRLPASQAASTNPTMLPFEYLVSSRLVFCIRHPALTFPSVCRGELEIQRINNDSQIASVSRSWMTYSYTRVLYDWYMSYARENESNDNITDPIVLSMNDIIYDPSIMVKVAESLELDPSKVQTTWSSVTLPEDDPTGKKVFRRAINQSTGVLKGKAVAEIDLIEEKKKWLEEFGHDLGSTVAHCVELAMPDYEYLMTKRFKGI